MRWKGVNWAGVNEIKSELYAGRGVAVCIRADQSLQNGENEERYINSSTWSHYAFEDKTSNHAVCIVGWDDTYSRDNFTHKVYVTDGETGVRVEDPALSELTTPGGDGAWIVKNSWGSETDCGPDDLGNEVDSRGWGVRDEQGRHTGYFYVSYYDKTLGDPESFEFTTDLAGQGRFYTAQHDYLPARYLYKETSDKVMSSANVFETGDELVSLKSVSTNTWAPEQHVDFAVYLIGDDARDPTDGTLAWRGSAQYAHAGYHRFDLEAPVDLAKGQRFSIVSTVYTTGSGGGRTYGIAANATYNRYMVDKSNEYAEAVGSAERMNTYGTAVVGKGQSYRYADGVWQDWSGYFDGDDWFEKLKAGGLVRPEETAEDYDNGLAYAVDNFSIKAYLVPTEDVVPTPAPQPTPSTRPSTTPRPSYAYTYTRPSRAASYGYGYGSSSSSSSDAHSTTSGTTGSAASASGSSRVSRLGGAGRYDTMAGLVREGFSSSEHAAVASGASFADALAASALAGAHGCPVVLTEPGTLSTQASSVLSALGVTDTTVVGGPAAVSDAVLAALGGDVRRIGGADRYATAIEAMRAVRGMDRSSDTVVVVTGTGFADALSIGPWAWRTKSPILLAMPDGMLRGDVVDAIKADEGIRRVVLVGGSAAVSDAVRDQLGDGYTFERLGGADRYETSAKVAAWSATHGLGWSRPVVAAGRGFADALSAAAVCGKTGSVLLLADAASDPTLGLLRQMRASVDRVWVAGGEAAVSASLMGAIEDALR